MASEGGYYAMHRGWMDNTTIREKSFNKPQAWCWLIEKAAWKNHTIQWRLKSIEIKRGQVPTSLRAMEEEFGWSQHRILRFINALKTAAMVEVNTAAGFYIITICNYEEYQSPLKEAAAVTAAPTAAVTAAPTAANRRIANKGKKEIKDKPPTPLQGGNGQPEFELTADNPLPPDRFEEFWKIYPCKEAKKAARKNWDVAITVDTPERIITAAKYYAAACAADPEKKIKYAQGWLSGERWRDYDDVQKHPGKPDLAGMSQEEHLQWVLSQAGLS